MAPLVLAAPGANTALLVVAMGAGSLVASHVNDGGFWVVKQYFNLTVPQTLKIWTTLETIVSVTALILVLIIDAILK
jgi:GntP family gluconate:H+ symporter